MSGAHDGDGDASQDVVSGAPGMTLDTGKGSPRARAAVRLQPPAGHSGAVDRLADLAARLLGAPAAQLSLLSDVAVIAGSAGLPPGAAEGSSVVADSLCTVTASAGAPLVVIDAPHDDRVAHLPPVTSGAVGAYLGAPLTDQQGRTVGALCVFGPQPRTWSEADVTTLQQLAVAAMAELELSALSGEHRTSAMVLEMALAAGRVGVFDLDLVAETRTWDERMLELFGITRETFDPRLGAFLDGVHPDDRAQAQTTLDEAFTAGGPFTTEYRVQLPDASTRWITVRGRALRDQHGRPVRVLGAAQDTTSLRVSETRTAALLESMAVAYLAIDAHWRITYLNAEAERIAGASRAGLVGREFWTAFPATVGTVFETNYRHAVAAGEVVTFDAHYPEPLNIWVEVRAVPENGGLGLYFLNISARRAAEDARDAAVRQQAADAQTMAGLVGAARDLGAAETEAEVLAVVTGHAEALLGVLDCALRLLDPGGGVRSVSASDGGQVLARFDLLPADHPLPAVHTAVTGEANFLPDLATITARFPGCEHIYAAGGIASSAAVPLRARGRLLGALSMGHSRAHDWRPAERHLLEAFAALTAQALDRLAAHQAEHAATALARRAAVQQAALSAIAYALQGAASEADVLDVISSRGKSMLGAAGAGLALLETDRSHVRILTTEYFAEDVTAQIARLPASAALPIVRAAVDGTAFFLTDSAAADALFPGVLQLYATARTEGSAEVPLRAAGTSFGTLSVAFAQPHTWESTEEELLEALAALTAQALARIAAREAERAANHAVARFSETLQRSLLTSPAQPDHLQIAVRYSPAAAQAQVGGDWYDAFLTADGSTSLVIGDVTGHDQQAAAAMGQLRNLLRGIGYALGEPPATVLSVLDRAIHDLAVGVMATVVIAQIEQSPAQKRAGLRTLRWSNAGHLPPLLITADGSTRYLATDPDLLVGLDPDASRADHEVVLQPGSSVLLFTDGLIERRDAPLQAGLDWLARTVADLADQSLDKLCDELLNQVGDRVEDDVALLAVRAHPEDGPRPPGAGPTIDPLRGRQRRQHRQR